MAVEAKRAESHEVRPLIANNNPRPPPYNAPRHQVEVRGQVPDVHWP